jgi:hypothetical protein
MRGLGLVTVTEHATTIKKVCFVLAVIAILVSLPALVHSHWGMFSDPFQVIWTCRELYEKPWNWNEWSSAICFDRRPGFHMIHILLWPLSGGTPFVYYAFRTACLAALLCVNWWNCRFISGSKLAAWAATALWFAAYGTYENLYTLDKGELYVAFGFSSAVLLQCRISQSKLSALGAYVVGLAMAILYVIFTKQTGQLIIVYFAALTGAHIILRYLLGNRTFAGMLHGRMVKISAASCGFTMIAFWVFQGFCLLFPGPDFAYFHSRMQLPFIASHLMAYLVGMPEIGIAFLLLTIGILRGMTGEFLRCYKDVLPIAWAATFASFAGAIALSAWESDIAYGWFPILAFVSPAVAFYLKSVLPTHASVFTIAFAATMLGFVPVRIDDSRLQLGMDALFNVTVRELLELPQKENCAVNVVLDLQSQSSDELGEEFKYLAVAKKFDKIAKSPGALLSELKPPLSIWNLFRPSTGNSALDKLDLVSSVRFLPEHIEQPGFDKFMYVRGDEPPEAVANVHQGDFLLAPFGSIQLKKIMYRGLNLFIRPESSVSEALPQLSLRPVFRTVNKFQSIVSGKHLELGWACFRITRAEPVMLPLEDGWLKTGTIIYCGKKLVGKTLVIGSRGSFVDSVRVKFAESDELVTRQRTGDSFQFSIPVTSAGAATIEPTDEKFSRPVMIHVDTVRVE